MTNRFHATRRPVLDSVDAANKIIEAEMRRAYLTLFILNYSDLAIELANEHHDRADAMIDAIHEVANAFLRNNVVPPTSA